ncbi:MAG: tRNA (guanosine(37)-N1)-methyltransferase TrmD [Erysipelothrix sp.]|nr:tRNA (guanosine(37)-N1)-methyltransferase TrmD [Erysipelothrix sp.]
MKITILTIFPEMFEGFINTSIIKKAVLQKFVDIEVVDFRPYTKDKHNRVDDTPYGGGPGLVLKYEPIVDALKAVKTEDSYTIMMTPAAPLYKQKQAHILSKKEHIIIICGHYEGYDERILTHVDACVSIGDYILTGGELGAMVVSDSIIRLIPGVITSDSIESESFENGLLEHAQYTKPQTIDGLSVPDVLVSGHHENINQYRHENSLIKTYINRPDLLENYNLIEKDVQILNAYNSHKRED